MTSPASRIASSCSSSSSARPRPTAAGSVSVTPHSGDTPHRSRHRGVDIERDRPSSSVMTRTSRMPVELLRRRPRGASPFAQRGDVRVDEHRAVAGGRAAVRLRAGPDLGARPRAPARRAGRRKRRSHVPWGRDRPHQRRADGRTRVETMGLEPTTPCLQSRCSSQLSYVPEGIPMVPIGRARRSRAANRAGRRPRWCRC